MSYSLSIWEVLAGAAFVGCAVLGVVVIADWLIGDGHDD